MSKNKVQIEAKKMRDFYNEVKTIEKSSFQNFKRQNGRF